MTITNDERARRADRALRAYIEAKGDDFESNSTEIVDLITDLLHLTNWYDEGDDPIDSTLRLAKMHYEAEIAEEIEGAT